jgi:hypothetical protein
VKKIQKSGLQTSNFANFDDLEVVVGPEGPEVRQSYFRDSFKSLIHVFIFTFNNNIQE